MTNIINPIIKILIEFLNFICYDSLMKVYELNQKLFLVLIQFDE